MHFSFAFFLNVYKYITKIKDSLGKRGDLSRFSMEKRDSRTLFSLEKRDLR